jgi:hypothetical protein
MEPSVVVNTTTYDTFTVSTIVTRSHFETRIFSEDGEAIPEGIKTTIKGRLTWTTQDYDNVIVGQDRESVESYSHSDAEDVHTGMSVLVTHFLNTHTRTITYVPNK